jgi:hypothetical protein
LPLLGRVLRSQLVESSESFPSTADTAALSPADMERPEAAWKLHRRKIAGACFGCCAEDKQ